MTREAQNDHLFYFRPLKDLFLVSSTLKDKKKKFTFIFGQFKLKLYFFWLKFS